MLGGERVSLDEGGEQEHSIAEDKWVCTCVHVYLGEYDVQVNRSLVSSPQTTQKHILKCVRED